MDSDDAPSGVATARVYFDTVCRTRGMTARVMTQEDVQQLGMCREVNSISVLIRSSGITSLLPLRTLTVNNLV